MEINKLKLFCSVAQIQNLRKAAELNGFSPGGASKAMRQIEEELGVKLFAPHGRGIVVTEEGRRASAAIEKILLEYSGLKERIREASQTQSIVRIASFEVFTSHFLGRLITDFLPDQEITCIELVPGRIEAAVAAGDVDFGITYAPVPHDGVDFVRVTPMEMGVFSKKGAFDGMKPGEIPFVVPITSIGGLPAHLEGLDGWPQNVHRKVTYRFELLESALILCRQGLAAIHCPKFVVKLQNASLSPSYRLTELDFPMGRAKKPLEIYLLKKRGRAEDALVRKIAKALRVVCSER